MWETIKDYLLSKDLEFLVSMEMWSAIMYLAIGVIAGAVISVKYALRAQRPKLIISGGGGGSGVNRNQHWNIGISNRPSFLGQRLDGESARDVYGFIQLDEKNSQRYHLFWGREGDTRVTIEPGQYQRPVLFYWKKELKGYFIADIKGEPIASFQNRELKFILTLRDRLERKTEFRFTVEFDDTHLKNTPRLNLIHPLTIQQRVGRAKNGLRNFLAAFSSR